MNSSNPSTPVGSPNTMGLGMPPRTLNNSAGNVPPPRPAPKKMNDSSSYPPLPPLPPTPKESSYPPLPPLPPTPSHPPLPPLPPTPNDPRSSRVLPSAPNVKISPTLTRTAPTPPAPKQPSLGQPTNKQATKEALKALSANSGGAGLRMRQASVRSFESVAKAAARPLPTPGVKKSITPAARPLPTPSAGKRPLPTKQPAAATNGGAKSAKRSLKDFEVLEMLGT